MTGDYETKRGSRRPQGTVHSHEPKRDCGRVDAHRPSLFVEVALGDGDEPFASNRQHIVCLRVVRPYAEIQRIDFAVSVVLVGQSGRHRIPRHPAARITRVYKLRQQPVDPGSLYCPGFFSVAVNAQKDILLICCSKVTGRGQNHPIRLSDTSSPLSRF
jgi:hypothetical protein